MNKKVVKTLLAIAMFILCVVAPGLLGILILGIVAYIVSDLIIEHIFGDDE